MRRTNLAICSLALALSLAGCQNSNQAAGTSAETEINPSRETEAEDGGMGEVQKDGGHGDTAAESEELESNDESNILIAYFTFPETDGTDTDSGASRVVIDGRMYGHMEYLAEVIQGRTGGELFEIQTVQEYPGTHEPLVDQAADEQAENARPELAAEVEQMDRYDTIFLGFPNWWGDMPMPLYTFLESYDLGGKTIIPFNSHGGSRFSDTIQTIQELQPEAEVVTDGFTVSRDDMNGSGISVEEWLEGLGY